MHLTTPHLLLREIRVSDGPILRSYSLHPDFRRYEQRETLSPDEFREITQWMISTQSESPRSHYYFALAQREKPEHPIGSIYISIRNHLMRQAEIGYILGVPYWNNGYMTEAARRVVQFGFEDLGMHRIYAGDIIAENIASQRVVEKVGFRREGHFRHTQYFKGRWWDTYTYAMLEQEWHEWR